MRALLAAALVASACIRERPAPSRTPTAPTTAPSPAPTSPTVPSPAPTSAPTPAPTAPTPAPTPDAPSTVRWVVATSGGARADERLPLVVAIHGLGDTPEAFVGLVTEMNLRVRVAAPAGLNRWGDGWSWFPSRAETPRAQWVEGIRHAADVMVGAMRDLARRHPTCGLPVVTGFSQGGMLSYAIVARPDGGVFAALPVGGLLPRELWPTARPVGGLLPMVVALHGDADARVPFADDRAASEAFRAAGFSAELVAYPGVGHTITPAMSRELRARLATAISSQGCAAADALPEAPHGAAVFVRAPGECYVRAHPPCPPGGCAEPPPLAEQRVRCP